MLGILTCYVVVAFGALLACLFNGERFTKALVFATVWPISVTYLLINKRI